MSEIVTTYTVTNEYNHTIVFDKMDNLADFLKCELESLNCLGDSLEFKICQGEMTRSQYDHLGETDWEL